MVYSCGDSCGYSSSGVGYGGLESTVNSTVSYSRAPQDYSSQSIGKISYMVDEQRFEPVHIPRQLSSYSSNQKYAANVYNKPLTVSYTPSAGAFLVPNRPGPVFVGEMNDIKEFIEQAFQETTGNDFPKDVTIKLVPKSQMKQGVLGFAINKKGFGVSEIVVGKGELDKIMLTIGHEIGHVLSNKLKSNIDEEAKAFAFQMAWLKSIKEFNIANLSTAIHLHGTALNGVHDVALDFVLKQVNDGEDPLELFNDLANNVTVAS